MIKNVDGMFAPVEIDVPTKILPLSVEPDERREQPWSATIIAFSGRESESSWEGGRPVTRASWTKGRAERELR